MSFLLHIDSAVQTASVCLSKDGKTLALKINPLQTDHASWLQPAIQALLEENNVSINNIDALSVSSGPGSYTGLRVGMATAKGLCYTLNKPLILINTLQMMAVSALNESCTLICPMIDARRMEVFTAIFNHSLHAVVPSHNFILSENSFVDLLEKERIIFFGNGSEKFRSMTSHPNAIFKHLETTAEQMVGLSYQSFLNKDFANLAYCEPLYGKEFFSPAVGKK
ncbi:MAG TPA: tRNA (adenosine(37)-N6)-threonylcarbamoyltransferase complex dimerization subunit type 1 TsaB [Chitinophagaceae bacterium]|nr:tRNA (adenosine(37)-N6)-threonylcarbamoyltransferase complex dimerization subunit type 1 TsaB [Chitinophagaceae bacterium]